MKTREQRIDEAEALNCQGCAFYNDKKYEEASEKFKGAYELCPDDQTDDKSLYRTNEANCYRLLGQLEKAIELYDEVLARDDNYKDAKIGKALCLNLEGLKLLSDAKVSQNFAQKFNAQFKTQYEACAAKEMALKIQLGANDDPKLSQDQQEAVGYEWLLSRYNKAVLRKKACLEGQSDENFYQEAIEKIKTACAVLGAQFGETEWLSDV